MTNTEKMLIRHGLRPESAKNLVAILAEFWEHGNTNCEHYWRLMKNVTASLKNIDLAEESYCQEFTEYDLIFQTPRLKTDPKWPKILEMVDDVRRTGKCPFCGEKMIAFDGRQICKPCDRAFAIQKRGAFNPDESETAFKEAANG